MKVRLRMDGSLYDKEIAWTRLTRVASTWKTCQGQCSSDSCGDLDVVGVME